MTAEPAEKRIQAIRRRTALERDLDRYLRTGDTDVYASAWPEGNLIDRCRHYADHLQAGLVAEVGRRIEKLRFPAPAHDVDWNALVASRIDPMVAGFFPPAERFAVCSFLVSRVKLVSPQTLPEIISEVKWPQTAWDVANLLFGSIGAKPLGRYKRVLGFCPRDICYVSLEYLTDDDPFADYVVHEAAHLLHNSKRRALGLPQRRGRERLVDVAFPKRETFAYGCEFYSRILARSAGKAAIGKSFRSSTSPCPRRGRLERTGSKPTASGATGDRQLGR